MKIESENMKLCECCNLQFLSKRTRQRFCSICIKQGRYGQIECKNCHIKSDWHSPRIVDTVPTFCNNSCKNSWEHTNGIRRTYINDKKTVDWWKLRYGDDWVIYAKAKADKLSVNSSGENNPMFGRRDQMHGLHRFVSTTIGKTVEEIYGEEKGRAIRTALSLKRRGELNPAFGKIYNRGGRSIKGYYNGHFFRSLLEYSFMKHLECLGHTIGVDVEYENFTVPYTFDGKAGTYCIDFHVKSENTVYEVKPSYVLKNTPLKQLAKWDAAKDFFKKLNLEFKVVTELDFQKLHFEDVYNIDKNVIWDERTFKYFRRTKCRVKK